MKAKVTVTVYLNDSLQFDMIVDFLNELTHVGADYHAKYEISEREVQDGEPT